LDQLSSVNASDKRRIVIALCFMCLALLVIACKLLWISVFAKHAYSSGQIDLVKGSVLHRQRALVLDTGRGDFYDRHMNKLTGATIQALAVFPMQGGWKGTKKQTAQICSLLGVDEMAWKRFFTEMKEPQLWPKGMGSALRNQHEIKSQNEPEALKEEQVSGIIALDIPNLQVIEYRVRVAGNKLPAAQLIGFVSQDPERIAKRFGSELESGRLKLTSELGSSGLEATLEPWLRGIGESTISLFTDAQKRPLAGIQVRMTKPDNPHYPLKVITTLDVGIQNAVEALVDRMKLREGAVVVLDAANSDVIAMDSFPRFNPNDIDLAGGAWSNRALKSTQPGSIFKTVVAAAALEEGITRSDEMFECKGSFGKYGFSCWKPEGHGQLTLKQAYADSCNITFAKLMSRLSASTLDKYARLLGAEGTVGWSGEIGSKQLTQLDHEEAGIVFADGTSRVDEGALVQTAIGQRDVRMTPLGAANLVATLLRDGEMMQPRVVKEVRFQNGLLMREMREQDAPLKEKLSKATSRELLSWMREVVTKGTGVKLKSAKWPLAGKSGTAQVITSSGEKENQWFIGYGPIDKPKYAVAVVVEGLPASASNQAVPLFRGVMDILAEGK
jgi:cell division protein FtsI/penicillin-binding protein 2